MTPTPPVLDVGVVTVTKEQLVTSVRISRATRLQGIVLFCSVEGRRDLPAGERLLTRLRQLSLPLPILSLLLLLLLLLLVLLFLFMLK